MSVLSVWPLHISPIGTRKCPECGLETDAPEGSMVCPVYHGDTYHGESEFCPIFVDAQTPLEVIKQYQDWARREADENKKLRDQLYWLKRRGLFERIFKLGETDV